MKHAPETTHIWCRNHTYLGTMGVLSRSLNLFPRAAGVGVPAAAGSPAGAQRVFAATNYQELGQDISHCEWSSFTNRPTGPKGPKATLWNTEFDKQFSKVSPWPVTWTKTAAGILFASLVRECHTSVCSFFLCMGVVNDRNNLRYNGLQVWL